MGIEVRSDSVKVRLYDPLPQQELYVLRLVRYIVNTDNSGKVFVWSFSSGSWQELQTPGEIMSMHDGTCALLPPMQAAEIAKQLAIKVVKE